MVASIELAWQNKTISRASDFRGVLILGLFAAWFYFVWRLLSLPPFEALQAGLPPLLRFALAKGKYMPDCGMIIAGFAAFHFSRDLQREWERRVALKVYLSAVLPLIAYLAIGVGLLEAVHMGGPAHALSRPWQDPQMKVQFAVLATAIVFAFIWPAFLYWMWTAPIDVGVCGVCLALIYFGMNFTLGFHRLFYMWPATALFGFMLGVSLCMSLFRTIAHLAPVRGQIVILGWMCMVSCSILAGPTLFFVGFLMVVGGSALSERGWFLPGERAMLAWSRTALGIVVAQPAALGAWLIWGQRLTGVGWIAVLALAAAVQIMAILLRLVIGMPARRRAPVVPA